MRRPATGRGLTATGPLLTAALALLAVAGCREPAPPAVESSPETAAMALIGVRVTDDGLDEVSDRLFVVESNDSRIELLDALDAIPPVESTEIARVERDPEGTEAYVDLEGVLAGGGVASFSVRLAGGAKGGWRIVWFQGPGLEWPIHRAKGDGLSQSAHPDSLTR